MAHFAQLNDDGIVTNVIVVGNQELIDENGNESEEKGIQFCKSLFGGNWIQTSYNNNTRKRYAGVGYKYRSDLDAFIKPKPFQSWLFDDLSLDWVPPVERPNDDKMYYWDEENLCWKNFDPSMQQ